MDLLPAENSQIPKKHGFRSLKLVNVDMDQVLAQEPVGVHYGRLDNGLFYYVRSNSKPRMRAALALAVKAGSVLEEEDERGVAHIVEHLAFSATTKYSNHDIIKFLESIGAEFGACQNAVTSADDIVYELFVPIDKPELLSQAMSVLAEFSSEVRVSKDDLEKERGAVMEEYRGNRNAAGRMQDAHWVLMMEGSRYAERLPIGLEKVIRTVSHETVKQFYRKWYHLSNMAVIAVGDFSNTQSVVELIKTHFGQKSSAPEPPLIPTFTVPSHEEPRFSCFVESEAAGSAVMISYKMQADQLKTVKDYRDLLAESMFLYALNQRFFKISRRRDPPYFSCSAAADVLVRPLKAYIMTSSCKEKGTVEALESMLIEVARVRQHGFSEREILIVRALLMSEIESAYLERDQMQSTSLRDEYLQHFLRNEPVVGIEYEAQLQKTLLPYITASEVSKYSEKLRTSCSCVIKTIEPRASATVDDLKNVALRISILEEERNISRWDDEQIPEEIVSSKPNLGPIRTVVWVANRRNPINGSSAVLMVNNYGELVLLNQNSTVAWSANSTKEARNPIVQLLDSGNLVLREENEENPENYLWQSFDYPSDTWLPGMKLGWDLRTGLERRLTAWKSPDDPSPGELSWGIELHDYPEIVMKKGSDKFFRTGPWNGRVFSGVPELRATPVYDFSFVYNNDEVYFMFHMIKTSLITRAVMNQTQYERYIWVDGKWKRYLYLPRDNCDAYNLCGAYGNCIIGESPACQCVQGFKPKSPDTWNPDEWSKGCVRSTQLSCQDKDKTGFDKFFGYKLPDTTYSWVNLSMNLEECRVKCLNNCTCMAYSNTDIRDGGSGCAMWFGDLIDIRQIALTGQDAKSLGQDVYIRMPASEKVKHKQKKKVIIVVVAAIAVVLGVLSIPYCICKRTNLREKMENNVMIDQNTEGQSEDIEVPFFSLTTIAIATDNFSNNYKLGEGGFGIVYKGTLTNGQEIAVKRLSRSSVQGLNEFKNEVMLIAKLQHRNLVRLLGYCIEGEEKMLIYEYMPNGSLDSFIFDQTRAKVLGWSLRFNIICGIARGLLYLHEDSRLRIVHRDLKAGNVLLDSKMNPKISDFGMARIFGGDQTEGNTNRVVGTYGYMAPEYAIDGLFSVKSDVFSFGILLLEILSAKKNRGFFHPSHGLNLVGHAWKLWKEGKPLELIDTCLKDSCILLEILRCLRISFLCLQQRPEDRPNMSSVVMMLHGESSLPEPEEPASFVGKRSPSSSKNQSSSTNEITVTMIKGR